MEDQTTPVLIVGGGPTGLLASILLSRRGVSHVLVERRAHTVRAPAAHVVNTRTMEIYRQAGLRVDELYALNTHPYAHLVTWRGRLSDPSIGAFDMASNRDALAAQSKYSREHTTNISQHRLEHHLKQVAEVSEHADIRFGHRWSGFASEDHLASTISHNGGEARLQHQYMIAADGAGSAVAQALDIPRIGPDRIGTFLNLTCEVDSSAVAGEGESLLYWLLAPEVQGTIIVHDPKQLAVYMRPLAVPYESYEDYDDERCEQIAAEVFGNQPCRIVHKGMWVMTAQVAERFREGPVFLAGDAVHRFPPTGGLGLNTGAGDVHNLVWKIAAALGGSSETWVEGLLESYELERKPVAQRNSDVSKRNSDKMIEVIQAIGLDPRKAGLFARVMNSWPIRHLPASGKKLIRRMLTKPVRDLLVTATAESSKGQAIQERVQAAIANQREHFSSLGLDLGYVYQAGEAVSSQARNTPLSEVSSYVETVSAGARFPERGLGTNGSGVHDFLDYDRFTLFTHGDVAAGAMQTFGADVHTVDLGPLACDDGASAAEAIGLDEGQWALVRPDGHVMEGGSH